jgi:hypothetical protein
VISPRSAYGDHAFDPLELVIRQRARLPVPASRKEARNGWRDLKRQSAYDRIKMDRASAGPPELPATAIRLLSQESLEASDAHRLASKSHGLNHVLKDCLTVEDGHFLGRVVLFTPLSQSLLGLSEVNRPIQFPIHSPNSPQPSLKKEQRVLHRSLIAPSY